MQLKNVLPVDTNFTNNASNVVSKKIFFFQMSHAQISYLTQNKSPSKFDDKKTKWFFILFFFWNLHLLTPWHVRAIFNYSSSEINNSNATELLQSIMKGIERHFCRTLIFDPMFSHMVKVLKCIIYICGYRAHVY